MADFSCATSHWPAPMSWEAPVRFRVSVVGRSACPHRLQRQVEALVCGLHVGPVVGGVVGKSKFSFDIWGDTINTAARPAGVERTEWNHPKGCLV
jgi:class 3 adenylate cyclase